MGRLSFDNPYSDVHHDDDKEDKVCYADELEAETDKAWGILGTDGKVVWLPKSQVTMAKFKDMLRFIVPAWLAKQKENLEFED